MRRSKRAHDSSASADASPSPVRDALFAGKIALWQPAIGYRVNVDSLLLADFARTRRPKVRHLVDLGSGVGAVSLAYGFLGSVGKCTLVERDAELAALAMLNLAEGQRAGTAVVLDVTTEIPPALRGIADVVVSNPPFFARGSRPPLEGTRSRSRAGPVAPFLRAAAAVMGRRAHVFFAYPAQALPEILAEARSVGLVPKRLRLVHAFAGTPARLALLEFRAARPGGLIVEPPVVEWSAPGARTPALQALVDGTSGSESARI